MPHHVIRYSIGTTTRPLLRHVVDSGELLALDIRTVRLATADEIEFCRWNEETLAREEMGRRV